MSLLSLIYTILEYFSFLDFKKNLKVGLSACDVQSTVYFYLAHAC